MQCSFDNPINQRTVEDAAAGRKRTDESAPSTGYLIDCFETRLCRGPHAHIDRNEHGDQSWRDSLLQRLLMAIFNIFYNKIHYEFRMKFGYLDVS
jgi:hypothetical protein